MVVCYAALRLPPDNIVYPWLTPWARDLLPLRGSLLEQLEMRVDPDSLSMASSPLIGKAHSRLDVWKLKVTNFATCA
jgi:hypothetical protein